MKRIQSSQSKQGTGKVVPNGVAQPHIHFKSPFLLDVVNVRPRPDMDFWLKMRMALPHDRAYVTPWHVFAMIILGESSHVNRALHNVVKAAPQHPARVQICCL